MKHVGIKIFLISLLIGVIIFLTQFFSFPGSSTQLAKAMRTRSRMLNQWAPQLANYFNENQRYPLVNNIDDLKRELNLSKKLDPVDGWGRNFIYKCENSDTYYLISYGFDGIPGNTVKVQGGQYDVSTDIIVKNGEIIQDFTSAKFE